MSKTRILTKLLTCFLCLFLIPTTGNTRTNENTLTTKLANKIHSRPLVFTENRGQVADAAGKPQSDVLFTARSGATTVFLTHTGISYQFTNTIYPEGYMQGRDITDMAKQEELEKQIITQTYRFSLTLAGCNPNPNVRREAKSNYTENYYLPHCPDGITDIAAYERLVYENVYPHIDWVVYSNGNRLKYDFVVHLGGDAGQIRLSVKDAEGVSITQAGELLMQTTLGEVREQAPVSYADGKKIATHFKRNSDGTIGFVTDVVPQGTTLIIDPSVTWATYYGGAGAENNSIALIIGTAMGNTTDGSGNIYLSGNTTSTTGIFYTGGFQSTHSGGTDAFLAKFDASGTILWATYYGSSSGIEAFNGVTTDASGNVFAVGYVSGTSTGLATAGAYMTVPNPGSSDGVIVKFNSTGGRIWATYYGVNTAADIFTGCTTDASGNLYATAYSTAVGAISLPNTTPGAFQDMGAGSMDGLLVKFDATGSRQWATYYGNTGSDILYRCVTDGSSVYTSGHMSGVGMASSGAYQTTYGGGPADAFLAKFDAVTGSRQWATYLGGTGSDKAWSCALDGSGYVYMAGVTSSTAGIASASGVIQTTLGGGNDGFIAQFDAATGSTCPWATYYGGTGADQAFSISTDASGNLIVAGTTASTAGIAIGGFQNVYGGGTNDAMLLKISPTGVLDWASYFGNTGEETGLCVAVSGGSYYMVGNTSSTTGIATAGAAQTVFGTGTNDAYLVKVDDVLPATITTDTIVGTPLCEGGAVSVPFTVTGVYTGGNVFTAELSDASGSFAIPVVIGTVAATTDDTITATIPVGTPTGAGYRIRVVSSTPVVTGTDNGTDITIDPLPVSGSITGTATVCVGATTALSNAATGGAWSSITTAVATIDATGVVTGVATGTTTISYTVTNSCGTAAATTIVTVNPLPDAGSITGTATVCVAATTALSNAATGGAWSSVTTGVATIDAAGVVTGVAAGTSTISYTVTNSCGTVAATTIVTVNPLPNAGSITGTATVCAGATTALSNAATGGAWSSVTTAIATVDAAGVVTGVAAGTSTISYTVTNSCGTAAATTIVTVNPLPNAGSITGTATVCVGATTALSNAATGGVWSSVTTTSATIDAAGVVTGVAAGTSNISYTVTNSCGTVAATVVVTVLATPSAGTITGTAFVCVLTSTTLGSTVTGGTWSSLATGIATVSATGVVTGVATGTATIVYTTTNSCGTDAVTTIATVNPLAPTGTITGAPTVCVGFTTSLSNTITGGTWSSADPGVATISATGVVTAIAVGTATISYAVSNSCGFNATTQIITVNPLPTAITGTAETCEAGATLLSSTPAGIGVWSGGGTIAVVGPTTGLVTGVIAGTAVISYILPTACYITRVVTVNPVPVISGASAVCVGATITLTATGTGTWSASNTNATVSASGVVSGITTGIVTISYTLPTGCSGIRTITVNPLPAPVGGTAVVCAGGGTTALTATGGGTWSSGSSAATVGLTTGLVTGVSAGTATITYTLPTGCSNTTVVTVNPTPLAYTVTGGGNYCAGGTGVHIGLSGSQTDATYQLYLGASPVGTALSGTGGVLDFGLILASGTYSVTAVSTTTTCINTMSSTVAVTVTPVVVPSVSVVSTAIGDTSCSAVAVTFTATPVNGGTLPLYQWWVNGTTTSATTNVYTYTPANGDVVRVKLTSNATCAIPDSAFATDTMTVLPSLMPSVSISASPSPSCYGTPVTFTATPVNGGDAPSFRWTKNDTNVATGVWYIYPFDDGDTVYCMMQSTYRCRLADSVFSSNTILSVITSAPPVVTITASPGTSVSIGTSVTLTAVTTVPVTYQWQLNGTNIAGATNATYTSTFADDDSVTCVVTATDVCQLDSSASVVMNVTTGVQTVTEKEVIQIFPNPTDGRINITLSAVPTKAVKIRVINAVGVVVYEGADEFANGRSSLDLQGYASGAYYVELLWSNGSKKVGQVVIIR